MNYEYRQQNRNNHQDTSTSLSVIDVNSYQESPSPNYQGKYRFSQNELNSQILRSLEKIAYDDLNAGNITQSLNGFERCFEHMISTNKEGVDSLNFLNYFKATLMNLNDIANDFIKQDKVKDAIKILKKCHSYIQSEEGYISIPELRNITFNNIACCYRRMGKLDKCLFYLQRAFHIITGLDVPELSGNTHINLCAVLSQMGNHKSALEHAKKAVLDCIADLNNFTKQSKDRTSFRKKITMLGIAYHNLAVEKDFRGDYDSALEDYKKALDIVEKNNGANDKLAQRLNEIYDEACAKNNQRKALKNNPYFSGITLKKTKSFEKKRPLSGVNKAIIRTQTSNAGLLPKFQGKTYFADKRIIFPNQINPIKSPTTMLNRNVKPPFFMGTPEEKKELQPNIKKDQQANVPPPFKQRPQTAVSRNRRIKEIPKKEKDSPNHSENISEQEEKNKAIEKSPRHEIEEMEKLFPDDDKQEDKEKYRTNRIAFLESLNNFHESRNLNSSKNNSALYLIADDKLKSPLSQLSSKNDKSDGKSVQNSEDGNLFTKKNISKNLNNNNQILVKNDESPEQNIQQQQNQTYQSAVINRRLQRPLSAKYRKPDMNSRIDLPKDKDKIKQEKEPIKKLTTKEKQCLIKIQNFSRGYLLRKNYQQNQLRKKFKTIIKKYDLVTIKQYPDIVINALILVLYCPGDNTLAWNIKYDKNYFYTLKKYPNDDMKVNKNEKTSIRELKNYCNKFAIYIENGVVELKEIKELSKNSKIDDEIDHKPQNNYINIVENPINLSQSRSSKEKSTNKAKSNFELEVEIDKNQELEDPIMIESAITIQKHLRGKIARDKYKLFKGENAKQLKKIRVVHNHRTYLFTLFNKINDEINFNDNKNNIEDPTKEYIFICHDFKTNEKHKLNIPTNLIPDINKLNEDLILDLVEFDLDNNKITLKQNKQNYGNKRKSESKPTIKITKINQDKSMEKPEYSPLLNDASNIDKNMLIPNALQKRDTNGYSEPNSHLSSFIGTPLMRVQSEAASNSSNQSFIEGRDKNLDDMLKNENISISNTDQEQVKTPIKNEINMDWYIQNEDKIKRIQKLAKKRKTQKVKTDNDEVIETKKISHLQEEEENIIEDYVIPEKKDNSDNMLDMSWYTKNEDKIKLIQKHVKKSKAKKSKTISKSPDHSQDIQENIMNEEDKDKAQNYEGNKGDIDMDWYRQNEDKIKIIQKKVKKPKKKANEMEKIPSKFDEKPQIQEEFLINESKKDKENEIDMDWYANNEDKIRIIQRKAKKIKKIKKNKEESLNKAEKSIEEIIKPAQENENIDWYVQNEDKVKLVQKKYKKKFKMQKKKNKTKSKEKSNEKQGVHTELLVHEKKEPNDQNEFDINWYIQNEDKIKLIQKKVKNDQKKRKDINKSCASEPPKEILDQKEDNASKNDNNIDMGWYEQNEEKIKLIQKKIKKHQKKLSENKQKVQADSIIVNKPIYKKDKKEIIDMDWYAQNEEKIKLIQKKVKKNKKKPASNVDKISIPDRPIDEQMKNKDEKEAIDLDWYAQNEAKIKLIQKQVKKRLKKVSQNEPKDETFSEAINPMVSKEQKERTIDIDWYVQNEEKIKLIQKQVKKNQKKASQVEEKNQTPAVPQDQNISKQETKDAIDIDWYIQNEEKIKLIQRNAKKCLKTLKLQKDTQKKELYDEFDELKDMKDEELPIEFSENKEENVDVDWFSQNENNRRLNSKKNEQMEIGLQEIEENKLHANYEIDIDREFQNKNKTKLIQEKVKKNKKNKADNLSKEIDEHKNNDEENNVDREKNANKAKNIDEDYIENQINYDNHDQNQEIEEKIDDENSQKNENATQIDFIQNKDEKQLHNKEENIDMNWYYQNEDKIRLIQKKVKGTLTNKNYNITSNDLIQEDKINENIDVEQDYVDKDQEVTNEYSENKTPNKSTIAKDKKNNRDISLTAHNINQDNMALIEDSDIKWFKENEKKIRNIRRKIKKNIEKGIELDKNDTNISWYMQNEKKIKKAFKKLNAIKEQNKNNTLTKSIDKQKIPLKNPILEEQIAEISEDIIQVDENNKNNNSTFIQSFITSQSLKESRIDF